eukprot:PhM_4_TR13451/c0_g1_i1/m.51038/K01950/E6.3.5.1, NADSYN1, QNS1, nadE; NAD+ synthase (glutamine-hydrolysing)
MPQLVTLATCNLNQWALDFEGNLQRIRESIVRSKAAGARYRLGPELEVSGYSCEDHFLEDDTFIHSWEVLAELLKDDLTDGILCDIGMPVSHASVRYNCRVFVLNRRIVLIRPKLYLANDGNYCETRWFSSWSQHVVEEFYLPSEIQVITGQFKVPFGYACVATRDTVIAAETCEELFTPESPHIALTLSGAEIITNGSGSHHSLRKLEQRSNLIRSATTKCGGVYMYANQRGCDGNRLYFDGCSMVYLNGDLVAQAKQFSLRDVEVVTATVDLVDIRAYRGSINSRNVQAANQTNIPRVDADITLSRPPSVLLVPSHARRLKVYSPEEEIAYGPACWLWDYLRRSSLGGYFLPLSGGADSASVCAIVGIMCDLVVDEVINDNQHVINDVQRITKDPDFLPETRQELAERIFFCVYMGTQYSTEETLGRARTLASEVGATFYNVKIDKVFDSLVDVYMQVGSTPPDITKKGTIQNIAMQNIQARSRMVLSYLFAQLLLWDQNSKIKNPGQLLVLGAGNVDEALRGYFTKYDCSSADINPIGGISKVDLKRFLRWAGKNSEMPSLATIETAMPTAELQPTAPGEAVQSDEVEMGMTYEELDRFGALRSVFRCGPVSMFAKLVHEWPLVRPLEVASKVKHFFRMYAINRHKVTTLTPSYHAETYSPDDNRFDQRPFLYNTKWPWQFSKIDEMAQMYDEAHEQRRKSQMFAKMNDN